MQTLHLRKDRVEERRLWIEGVSASWHPRIRPNVTDVDVGGRARWLYEFRVDNPGRFPISDVEVAVHFDLLVERIEHGNVSGGVSQELKLYHAVLRGGGHRTWKRRLEMTYAEHHKLDSTVATVTFRDVDGHRHSTRWPSGD
jgi:hypothetical protein